MNNFVSLIRRLEDDLQDIAKVLIDNQDNSALECSYVRAYFAAIEGIMYVFRQEVIQSPLFKDQFDIPQQANLLELKYNKYGNTITKKPKYLTFKQSVKCSCRALAKVRGKDYKNLPFHGHGWEKVLKANEIRDKLVHPKSVNDLCVGQEGLTIILESKVWLKEQVYENLVE